MCSVKVVLFQGDDNFVGDLEELRRKYRNGGFKRKQREPSTYFAREAVRRTKVPTLHVHYVSKCRCVWSI